MNTLTAEQKDKIIKAQALLDLADKNILSSLTADFHNDNEMLHIDWRLWKAFNDVPTGVILAVLIATQRQSDSSVSMITEHALMQLTGYDHEQIELSFKKIYDQGSFAFNRINKPSPYFAFYFCEKTFLDPILTYNAVSYFSVVPVKALALTDNMSYMLLLTHLLTLDEYVPFSLFGNYIPISTAKTKLGLKLLKNEMLHLDKADKKDPAQILRLLIEYEAINPNIQTLPSNHDSDALQLVEGYTDQANITDNLSNMIRFAVSVRYQSDHWLQDMHCVRAAFSLLGRDIFAIEEVLAKYEYIPIEISKTKKHKSLTTSLSWLMLDVDRVKDNFATGFTNYDNLVSVIRNSQCDIDMESIIRLTRSLECPASLELILMALYFGAISTPSMINMQPEERRCSDRQTERRLRNKKVIDICFASNLLILQVGRSNYKYWVIVNKDTISCMLEKLRPLDIKLYFLGKEISSANQLKPN